MQIGNVVRMSVLIVFCKVIREKQVRLKIELSWRDNVSRGCQQRACIPWAKHLFGFFEFRFRLLKMSVRRALE